MKMKLCWLLSCHTLLALLLAACIVPATTPMARTAATPAPIGIDPASRLAQSVLLESCTQSACELQPIEPATGKVVPGYAPVPLGQYTVKAFAPDRRSVAMITYRNSNIPIKGVLKLVDLQAWKTITTTLTFDGQSILLSRTTQQDGKTELAAFDPQSLKLIYAWVGWDIGYGGWWTGQ